MICCLDKGSGQICWFFQRFRPNNADSRIFSIASKSASSLRLSYFLTQLDFALQEGGVGFGSIPPAHHLLRVRFHLLLCLQRLKHPPLYPSNQIMCRLERRTNKHLLRLKLVLAQLPLGQSPVVLVERTLEHSVARILGSKHRQKVGFHVRDDQDPISVAVLLFQVRFSDG